MNKNEQSKEIDLNSFQLTKMNEIRNTYLREIKERNFTNALLILKKAVELYPNSVIYNDLCEFYIKSRDFYNAINTAKVTIKMDKNNFTAWFLLGFALKCNKQIDDSIIAYQRAIELNPGSVQAYHNLGNIYNKYKNEPEKTIKCYEKVLELEPENPYVESCLGILYLKVKDYKKGWKYYQYSVKEAMKNSKYSFMDVINISKFWDGKKLSKESLFVYFNGGLGDTIMFARFLPFLKEKCSNVTFCAQNSLVELFKDSNLGMDILKEDATKDDIKFDYHVPLMDLGNIFEIYSQQDIPFADGYIKSNPKKVQEYKEKYFNNNKFKIGIKWCGNPQYSPNRHFSVKEFSKLLTIPNTKFYSFQKGTGIQELYDLKDERITDLGSGFKNFSDTAAALENVDLVICNDTSLAHLAGAMGKKCWVVLPFIQDWRWSTDINYCPWYSSVKMFKQSDNSNSWTKVFNEVYGELQKVLAIKLM